MFIIWIIVFIVLSILELLTINLVSIWFATGALITAILSLFIEDELILYTTFAITSLISLILTRRITKKILVKDTIPTNTDRLIGKTGIVTKDITKTSYGEVKIDGKYWTAISNTKIDENKQVEIISIEGVKLKVKEVKEEN